MVNIRIRVRNLVRKYGTRNPEKLAEEFGIEIIKRKFKRTLGFFKKELGKKFIVVNSNLNENMQQIVIAHELGHALLHSNNRSIYIHEYTLFPRGRVEIEANIFSAELLIDENQIDKHYLDEMCTSQIASYFGVPKQLVEYKFRSIKQL